MLMRTPTLDILQKDIITSSSLSLWQASRPVCYLFQYILWQLVTYHHSDLASDVFCIAQAFKLAHCVIAKQMSSFSRFFKRELYTGEEIVVAVETVQVDYAYAVWINCSAVCVANNIFSSSYTAHYHMELLLARTAVEGRPTYFR